MERSEPTLVPEWLKGGATGGGSTPHHFASSSQSDDHSVALPSRNKSSVSSSDYDALRSSAFVDKTSSSYFRRSSSTNGAIIHDKETSSYSRSYSSFSRSHRDRDWEKELEYREKDRLLWGDNRDCDYTDSLTNVLASRIERDTLRRSQSMISGKRGEVWPRKVGNDMSNGPLVGGNVVSSIHKAAFERDFPSLGAEEKQGPSDICRVSSPGLSSASQILPLGSSAVIGGDGWTSALAEVPVMIASSSTVLSSVQQTAPSSSAIAPPSTTSSLNMAETLSQAPSWARTVPQPSVETQRLEELAIKQSRQLIPMTPSMPKTMVLSSSEKPKPKARAGELTGITKLGQQPSSSQLANHALRGSTRSDVPKTSQVGKLLVLKAAREKNGVSPTAKDIQSPTNVSTAALGLGTSAAFAPLRNSNSPKLVADRKAATLSMTPNSSLERKPQSQAQNRTDFFNSLRKKTSVNSPSVPDSSTSASSLLEKSNEQIPATAASVSEGKDSSDPVLNWSTSENGSRTLGNGDACRESGRFSANAEKNTSSDEIVYPNEEEAAFLRSLGWDENAGEEEQALTEEEINAFYVEYMKLRPSSRLFHGMQQSKIVLFESRAGSSSGLRPSKSVPEA